MTEAIEKGTGAFGPAFDEYIEGIDESNQSILGVFVADASLAAARTINSAMAIGSQRYLDQAADAWGIIHRVGATDYEERYAAPYFRRAPNALRLLSSSATRAEFDRYRKAWQDKTTATSVLTDMVLLDEYQHIIGLGRPAIPFIMEALRKELDHWFWALKAIVGEDHAEGASSMKQARTMWIDWYDSLFDDE